MSNNLFGSEELKYADFSKVGEVCNTITPRLKIKSKDYLPDGKYPIIDQGSEYIGGYTNEEGVFPDGEYVIFGDHTCVVKYVDFPFAQGADGVKVLVAKDTVLPKYLFYCMENIKMDSDYSRHWSKMRDVKIPVPSLEVQGEIVKKLDYFTDLILKLNDELELRKVQFQYYIDETYGSDSDAQKRIKESHGISIKTLNDIGTFTRGKRFVKADSVEDGTPCIHYGELYTHYGTAANVTKSFLSPELAAKLRFAKKGDVVIVAAGENNIDIGVGVAWEGDGQVAVHDACYIFSHNQNPRYISYYLRSGFYHRQIKRYVAEGKICSISSDGIGKATIPIPPIEVQNQIVDELNLFNALCYNVEKGIIAEIKERKKQYAFYRQNLLAFKEM